MNRFRAACRELFRLALGLGVLACAAGTPASTQTADQLLVVDCLLPGQVRKLGGAMTFMTARRPIKTSAEECELRGGEYTAYDRANYATALKTWLPLAEQGDKEAQTFVGEVFEKGLGTIPDPVAAAVWYRKAADQGFARAQINLGYLYEKGLGVNADPVEALNWYRKASGINEAIMLEAEATEQIESREAEIARRDAEIARRDAEIEALKKDLDTTRGRLDELRRGNEKLKRERDALTRERNAAAAAQDTARVAALEARLKQQEQEAANQRAEIARFEQSIASYHNQLTSLSAAAREQTAKIAQATQTAESARAAEAAAKAAKAGAEADAATRIAQAEKTAESARRAEQAAKAAEAAAKAAKEAALAEAAAKVALAQKRAPAAPPQAVAATATPAPTLPMQVAIAPPTIQMIDPPLVITRGPARVALSPGADSRKIIGRVHAVAGLMSITVNDRSTAADAKGLFSMSVPVQGSQTRVQIAAVDKLGNRSQLEFVLVPEAPAVPPKPLIARGQFGNYHALVIGNQQYQRMPKLDTAVADAREVSRVLSDRFGFKVTTLTDATRYQTLSALNKMRASLTEKDNLLIYYAGHGELDRANLRAHWLPVDAEPDSDANWISTVAITDILNAMSAKHVMLVVDSCYSGAMTRSAIARIEPGRSDEARVEWLKALAKSRSRTVLTSGGLQPVVDGGGGRHSLFAKQFLSLLNSLDEPIEGQRLYQAISARVLHAALGLRVEQKPEYAPLRFAGHESGDFLFVPGK